MVRLGVSLTPLPFELHPEIPLGGVPAGSGRRSSALSDRIAAECEQVGLPYRRPERVPNTRRALEVASWVRMNAPEAFPALDVSLFAAHFAEGADIGDPAVLDDLVARAGADAGAAADSVARGEMAEVVRSSMAQAYELGVAATPTWLLGRMIVPGLQPREMFERLVTRLRSRSDPDPA